MSLELFWFPLGVYVSMYSGLAFTVLISFMVLFRLIPVDIRTSPQSTVIPEEWTSHVTPLANHLSTSQVTSVRQVCCPTTLQLLGELRVDYQIISNDSLI